jgi:hypothetical protein
MMNDPDRDREEMRLLAEAIRDARKKWLAPLLKRMRELKKKKKKKKK